MSHSFSDDLQWRGIHAILINLLNIRGSTNGREKQRKKNVSSYSHNVSRSIMLSLFDLSVKPKGYFWIGGIAQRISVIIGTVAVSSMLLLAINAHLASVQAQGQSNLGVSESIGKLTSKAGQVSATHVDGSMAELSIGAPISQGDVLITGPKSTIGLVFLDNSSFAIGEEARIIMDKLVYDFESGKGASAFTLLQGVLAFVSGDIAHNNPGQMTLRTPVGNMAIRGTEGLLKGNAAGKENAITLLKGGPVDFCTLRGCASLKNVGESSFANTAFASPSRPVPIKASNYATHYGEQVNNLLTNVLSRESFETAKVQAVLNANDLEISKGSFIALAVFLGIIGLVMILVRFG
jgi:hypothetical protein